MQSEKNNKNFKEILNALTHTVSKKKTNEQQKQ